MNKKQLLTIVLTFIFLQSFGQEIEKTMSKKELRKSRSTYIDIGVGLNFSAFRDFATSPLFYYGTAKEIFVSRLKMDEKRESSYGIKYSFGEYVSNVNKHEASSEVKSFSLDYSQLYQIPKWSNEKWNFKVGGVANITSHFRLNESLLNNGLGIESFITLFGSAKVTRDISRKKTKEIKIWFIKYQVNPKKRKLSYQLNIGLMNNTFRNGYIYGTQSPLLNNPNVFDGYQLKMFSGFRMNSALKYTTYLKNKNAIQFSYVWDAYKTGGNLDKFEMGNHSIRFSLLFNTK